MTDPWPRAWDFPQGAQLDVIGDPLCAGTFAGDFGLMKSANPVQVLLAAEPRLSLPANLSIFFRGGMSQEVG